MIDSHTLTPIGIVRSPYKEKFAIPRQAGLVPHAKGSIVLSGDANNPACVEGLTDFSHIWVLFIFHQNVEKGWQPKVRPPRLGGNARIGVFATRATHRPNHIGMSVLALDDISISDGQVCINVSGLDLLDGTPIIDIKPYIAYSDSYPDSRNGFVDAHSNTPLAVRFDDLALAQLQQHQHQHPELLDFITNVLAQDPRPAYRKGKNDNNDYGMRLYDLNINFTVTDNVIWVRSVCPDTK